MGLDEYTTRRFLDQMHGTARREYPRGRMGADDDGVLAYAIALDPKMKTIIIRFGTEIEWVGLGVPEAEQLIDVLQKHVDVIKNATPHA